MSFTLSRLRLQARTVKSGRCSCPVMRTGGALLLDGRSGANVLGGYTGVVSGLACFEGRIGLLLSCTLLRKGLQFDLTFSSAARAVACLWCHAAASAELFPGIALARSASRAIEAVVSVYKRRLEDQISVTRSAVASLLIVRLWQDHHESSSHLARESCALL